jgi:hypothetical protein
MTMRVKPVLGLVVVLVLVATVGACGGGVTSSAVSHEDTNDMVVWSPPGDGPWPLVFAIPDSGGDVERDLGVLAPELAANGLLVIGTDIRTRPSAYTEVDVECGYRYARQIAADYGGDLSLPVTMLGFSLGAFPATVQGLNASRYGPDGIFTDCFSGEPRPDLVVTVAGCHLDALQYTSGNFTSTETAVVLVSGAEDTVCPTTLHTPPMQELLEERGFDVTAVEIAGADHGGLVFHEQGSWEELPIDDPAGQATVDAIVAAVEDMG